MYVSHWLLEMHLLQKDPWLPLKDCLHKAVPSVFDFCPHFPNHDEFSGRFAFEWKWVVLIGSEASVVPSLLETSNMPPTRRWPMGKSNNCESRHLRARIWRLMWVVPLVSGASQVAVCWTSFQSYNRQEGENVLKVSFLCPILPHLLLHHCGVKWWWVSLGGDGHCVHDVCNESGRFSGAAVVGVGVDGGVGVVDGGVGVGGVDGVDGGVGVDSGVDGVDGDWCLSLDRRPQLLHRALQILHLNMHGEILDVREWCWFSKQVVTTVDSWW